MRWRAAGWWVLALGLLPILLPQAIWTRRTALRLPEADGPQSGLAGSAFSSQPLRLVLIGESTVAGVGVSTLQDALAGQLAYALSERLRRPVTWRACGENGITAVEAQQRLLPQALGESSDLAVLVFGVNDTTHFSSLNAWRGAIAAQAQALAGQGAQVFCSAVPPIEHFSALPWLLRTLLGLRARQLDRQLVLLAQQGCVQYLPLEVRFADEYLAQDGYHPSHLGYRLWAQALAQQIERKTGA